MSDVGGGGGSQDWCTIESDPGVFTELLERLGVQGVELQELWSLDDDSLISEIGQSQVYGLIFLFQWMGSDNKKRNANNNDESTLQQQQRQPLPESEIPPDLFFAHQVTTNACATQAILSVLFNSSSNSTVVAPPSAEGSDGTEAATSSSSSSSPGLELGPVLSEFQSFTKDFPPSLKGVAISSSEEIKNCHNSFSRQDAFLEEDKWHIPTGKEEAFHFVAYVPVHGVVYELDGLQKGPIVVGDVASTTAAAATEGGDNNNTATLTVPSWLKVARQAIQDRMALYQTQEGASGSSGEASAGSGGGIKFNLMAVIQDKRAAAAHMPDATDREVVLQREEAKRQQWKLENERRRHNYVPLCVQMLQELARLGTLPQLAQQATERMATKRAAKKGPGGDL